MAKAELEGGRSRTGNRIDIGSRLYALIDLRKVRPVKQTVGVNRASSQITSWVFELLLVPSIREAVRRSAVGFLAVSGDAPFAGNEFPDKEGVALRAKERVTAAFLRLLSETCPAEVSWSEDGYRISLLTSNDRANAQEWAETTTLSAAETLLGQTRLEKPKSEPPSTAPDESSSVRADRIAALLEVIPKSLSVDQIVDSLKELEHEYRLAVAKRLQPLLNQELQVQPKDSYAEKQSIASWVNRRLKEIGLAIKCPKTGRPANLFADIKQAGSEISRFRLEIRDEKGHKVRTYNSRSLPELELVEDEPRREPLVKWSEIARRPQSDRSIE